MDQTYPDPFQEAAQHGLQRALQIGAAAATAAQVYIYQQQTQARAVSEHDERTRRALNSQIRAERDAARSAWAPALDRQWLRQADLTDTARAWGAAMPYADRNVPWYEPSAATAMRKCEDRLRHLHPYAMARYDRLRAEGLGPGDAMREAAPLFANAPHAHGAPSVSRESLGPGDGQGTTWTASAPVPESPRPGADTAALEARGRQILARLQARAREQGRGSLGEDEQRTVLETVTDLPPEVIDRIVGPGTMNTAATSAGTGPVKNARPWRHDFPAPIQDVVATATRSGTTTSTPSATRPRPARQADRHTRRRN
jgi:hypothetical protein